MNYRTTMERWGPTRKVSQRRCCRPHPAASQCLTRPTIPISCGDCMTLLAAKDTLRGTGTLNWTVHYWSVDVTIADWDGITSGGTPSRVTRMELEDEGLTGSIPVHLGNLLALTHLDLSDNSLTGGIPVELGLLQDLVELRLSGNSLTGCIPPALQGVPTNDSP